MEGWFSIHRPLLTSDLWLSEKFTRGQVWVDLIGLANHAEGYIRKRGIRLPVNRGEVGWSMGRLAERWQWSEGKVRRFFIELEYDERIVWQRNNVSSLIVIKNYNNYQLDGRAINMPNSEQTASKQVANNNDKNVNNEKNEIPNVVVGAIQFWERNFGSFNDHIFKQLQILQKEHKEENLLKALEVAIEANKANLGYVKGILNSEKENGYVWQKISKEQDNPLFKKLKPGEKKIVERMMEEFRCNTGDEPQEKHIKLMIEKLNKKG